MILRNILAVVVAFFVGGLAVFGVEAAGHQVYPLPPDLNGGDMQAVAQYVATAPSGALLFVLLAQSAGSFVGGFVTAIIGGSNFLLLALIYGGLALTMAALNVVLIPHPLWMTVFALLLPIPLSVLGSRLGQLLWPPRNPA